MGSDADSNRKRVDWVIIQEGGQQDTNWSKKLTLDVKAALEQAEARDGLRAIIWYQRLNDRHKGASENHATPWVENVLGWRQVAMEIQATSFGSPIESLHRLVVATKEMTTIEK